MNDYSTLFSFNFWRPTDVQKFLIVCILLAYGMSNLNAQFPSGFSKDASYDPTDWTATYDDCTGTLRLEFKINSTHPTGQFAIGTMKSLNIQILRSNGTRFKIFELNEGSTVASAPYFLGVSQHTTNASPAYNSLYWYTAIANSTFTRLYTEPSSGLFNYALRVDIRDLPDDLFNTTSTVEFNPSWTVALNPGGNGSYNTQGTKSITQSGVGSGHNFGLATTQNESCDHIALTWSNPTAVGCNQRNFTDIERRVKGSGANFSHIARVPFNASSYSYGSVTPSNSATAPAKNEEYEYRVVHLYYPNGYRYEWTSYSNTVTGRRRGAVPTPSDLTATQDDCDDITLLRWNWPHSTNNLRDFQIERRLKGTSTWGILGYPSKTETTYDDITADYDKIYEYRISSRNDCPSIDLSAPSNVAEGLRPGPPIEPIISDIDILQGGFQINWTVSANTVNTGYIIERTVPGGGSPFLIKDIPAGARSYTDNDVVQCVTYTYRLKATSLCYPDGLGNGQISGLLSPDLDGTFIEGDGGFSASKGYYPDKVELTWNNQNESLTNVTKISRRILGSQDGFSLLTTLNGGSGIFNDLSTDAGELYEYEITAEAPCENVEIESNRVRTIGFRRKTGVVTGKVSYEGGVAVEDVKITADDPASSILSSLLFANNDSAIIAYKSSLDISDDLIIETWMNPANYNQDFELIRKEGAYVLGYNHMTASITCDLQTCSGLVSIGLHRDSVPVSQWNHIAASMSNDSLKLYINGKAISLMPITSTASINPSNSEVVIGKGFGGFLKEIRIWNTSKTDKRISQDHGRFLAGGEEGLRVYLNAGEGRGNYSYDLSKIASLFNRNHALLSSSSMWALNEAPSVNQLSIGAFTNANGNYNLIVPYSGVGQNFVLTPVFGTHVFDPSTRPVFIGDGSSVQNGIDFLDISAFTVTGRLLFDGMNCPSNDVFVKIDGEVVIEKGSPVRTMTDGSFTIDVPIGKHILTLEKNGHVFSAGRFPIEGLFDFQEPVSGIEFKDSTLRNVIGRVVGGRREGDKLPGLGRSKNNIGVANLTFDPSQTCGWIAGEIIREDSTITTDPITGEYSIMLPPLEFLVKDVDIESNPLINLGPAKLMDLTNLPVPREIADTLFQEGTDNIVSIDQIGYHQQWDYVYRANPAIDVRNRSGNGPLTGEDEFVYSHSKFGTDTLLLSSAMLPYPVFTQNARYTAKISTFEEYINKDGTIDITDRVPVTDGILTINNELAVDEEVIIDLSQEQNYNGDTLYSFLAGSPNIAENVTTPELSFTRPFKVDLSIGSQSDSWKPLATHDEFFRGYVLGAKDIEQSDFVTQGPESVDYILRDPPGSQSYASLTKGTTVTNEESWQWNVGADLDLSETINGGAAYTTGIGFLTETKADAVIGLGYGVETNGGEGRSVITSTTFTDGYTTSSDPLLAGHMSDLFIGSSRNYLFGGVTSLTFVPTDVCDSTTTLTCFNNLAGGISIAIEKTLAIAKGDITTTFVYTRNKIESDEIPDLQSLRNEFLSTNPKYDSKLSPDHPCFGFNNDDPRFNDNEVCPNTGPAIMGVLPLMTDLIDGPSYKFNRLDLSHIDTMRIFNQQIRLWKEALAFDEMQKDKASDGVNYSYGGGGASFSRSTLNSREVTTNSTVEFQFTESPFIKLGFSVGGSGFEDEYRLTLTQSRSKVKSRSDVEELEIEWTISDDSEWDDFSFDVYPGNNQEGPIFKTVGGRTSCPWEGPVMNKYYKPKENIILSPGTIKLEQPDISISPSVLYNVPQDEIAVFTMILTNNNTVGEGWEYATKLLPETNPNSLGVNVGNSDDLTRTWVIPAQSSITRDIFVGIGNAYVYEDLVVAFHSTCQYQQGLSEEEDIVDEATFSVSFVPECTDITLSNPENNWVLNNSFDNNLNLIASDYNINHLNLDNITIDYKPSNENDWVQLEKFYRDTTGMDDAEALQIDRVSPLSLFSWNVEHIPDGPYDLRATSDCTIDIAESPVYSGRMDRINPHAFGSPSPADGVLDPDDDILITFNEVIDNGTASPFNFDVRGVLNGTELRHAESLSFDGTNDVGRIPAYQLQKRSFTAEFWIKKTGSGAGTILSQGLSPTDQLVISIDNNHKVKLQLGDVTAVSDAGVSLGDWHHVAIAYNRDLTELSFFIDNALAGTNSNFIADYTGDGDLFIGRDATSNQPALVGELHELRLWGVARTLAQIAPKSSVVLSGREEGLIGNWPMDEAYGDVAYDKVRSRHMLIDGATWAVAPQSHAYQLDGTADYLKVANAGLLSMSDESDITIEGWIKTPGIGRDMTILSNGDPDASRPTAWNLFINPAGQLQIENNGVTLGVSAILDDDNWHHFAMVLERSRAMTIYVDRKVVLTSNAQPFEGYGGASLYLGAKGYPTGGSEVVDDYFKGALDDIRIWNVARRPEQIARDFNNQLTGDEPGLMAYYPFDDYRLELGVPVLDQTLNDVSEGDFNLTAFGASGLFTTSTPTMRLPRPVEKVNFTYSINGDQIFIEPTDPANRLENVTLDITVKGIRDLAGNYMESPETWIAYVDQNQVFWDTEYFEFEKAIDDEISFTAKIRNTGGRQERFDISNLPPWMSASLASGLIDPNSSLTIDFTISNFVELGSYEQDVFVTTESVGFNERLLINLLVEAEPPTWEVEDPSQYPSSMSYVGEIIIDGAISTDERDLIVAYVNDTIRGVANVEKNLQTGKHLVFLVIQGGKDLDELADEGKTIVFKVWDASEDKIHPYVTPSGDTYEANGLRGSLSTPIPFATTGEEELTYILKRGWNWISFPIEGSALQDLDQLFSEVRVATGDRITNHRESGIYISENDGWLLNGSLKRDGLSVKDGYRFYISNPDTFSYRGFFKDPSALPITLSSGWNSIGVISENNIDIATALASLDAEDGDIIKGQKAFAVYEEAFGWSGPLSFLEPQQSYMLKVNSADDLIFPTLRTPKSKRLKSNVFQDELYAQFGLKPELHESTMSMVVTIEDFDDWNNDNEWLVAAYVGDECRGINVIRMDDARNTRLAYLSLYGQESENVRFYLLSKNGKHKIPILEHHVLMSDGFMGVPSNPEIMHVDVSTCSTDILVDSSFEMLQNQTEIQAASTIALSTTINHNQLSLKAGEGIELMPGFQTMEGTEIQFFITPCNR